MTDTPRKKLSLSRKPKPTTGASAAASEDGTGTDNAKPVKRSGKRRIVNTAAKPSSKAKPAYDKSKKRPPRKNKKKALVSPSDLKAQALDKRLSDFEVWSTYKPLTLGIDKAVYQLVNTEAFPGASKKVVQKLLRMHTNNPRYLQALSRGGVRYHLDGTPAETISDHQQQLAVTAQAKRAGRVIKK